MLEMCKMLLLIPREFLSDLSDGALLEAPEFSSIILMILSEQSENLPPEDMGRTS